MELLSPLKNIFAEKSMFSDFKEEDIEHIEQHLDLISTFLSRITNDNTEFILNAVQIFANDDNHELSLILFVEPLKNIILYS